MDAIYLFSFLLEGNSDETKKKRKWNKKYHTQTHAHESLKPSFKKIDDENEIADEAMMKWDKYIKTNHIVLYFVPLINTIWMCLFILSFAFQTFVRFVFFLMQYFRLYIMFSCSFIYFSLYLYTNITTHFVYYKLFVNLMWLDN